MTTRLPFAKVLNDAANIKLVLLRQVYARRSFGARMIGCSLAAYDSRISDEERKLCKLRKMKQGIVVDLLLGAG
ncbi:hypothetical protein ACFYWX_35190 [Streptomyces sp. NPDC002888]|uniref:hypothetical protein n=1 Tax=Streptomyces sp. NPDC002888 TaxID=3364668 RepID=UPI0036B79949